MTTTTPGSPTIAARLQLARELGWRVECLDPETGWLWQLERDGRRHVLLGGYAPINDHAAAELARDKAYAGMVLARAGLRVPISARCIAPGAFVDALGREMFSAQRGDAPGQALAERVGWPLVVKPNAGSRGRAVNLATDAGSLGAALEQAWALDDVALVQAPVEGFDLRVDVLDGELLLAYVRRPLVLVGDGQSSVAQLHARVDPRAGDPVVAAQLHASVPWLQTLGAAELREASVLEAGRRLEFRTTIYNLNRCCVAELVRELPAAWTEYATRVGAVLGLRHCGVDLRVPWVEPGCDPLAQDVELATILEVNGSPSVGQIGALCGPDEARVAELRVMQRWLGR